MISARGAEGCQRRGKRAQVERLDEMVIEPGGGRAKDVCVTAVTGHGDQLEAVGRPSAAEFFGDLITVQAGEADIEQDDVGLVAVDTFDRGGPVKRAEGLVAAQLEDLGQGAGGVSVVVGDQDPEGPAGLIGLWGRGRGCLHRYRAQERKCAR